LSLYFGTSTFLPNLQMFTPRTSRPCFRHNFVGKTNHDHVSNTTLSGRRTTTMFQTQLCREDEPRPCLKHNFVGKTDHDHVSNNFVGKTDHDHVSNTTLSGRRTKTMFETQLCREDGPRPCFNTQLCRVDGQVITQYKITIWRLQEEKILSTARSYLQNNPYRT